ncbi:uncharacterized protein LOC127283816 [Leptopilina boulardi]|uniref:uncharacterized protein LOC127283816 n=1 Tax=Leptopilina boulardi TaxID=63433 RepID=UPI0021F5AFA2|nr:uncharacterized protein LOC127283816 [Leptopilina boulardi]
MSTLYDYMLDDWNSKKSNEELEIMIKSGQEGKKFSHICIIMGQVSMSARLFQWTMENMPNWNSPEKFKNFTLFADAYFPFQWNYSPTFEIICCFEFIGTLFATLAYSGTDSYFSQISFHYTAQYHILRLRLMYLINNCDNTKFKSEYNEEFNNIINSYAFANTAYESKWFNLPSQKANCLLLLMQSGNKPVEITAGKFVVFNFALFGSVSYY